MDPRSDDPMEPRYGDLIRVALFDPLDHYAIVTKTKPATKTLWAVAGNGLTAQFRFDQVVVIPLHEGSSAHNNFAEILKHDREFIH